MWVVIFLVRIWGSFWHQNNSDLLIFFLFWIFNTSRFSEWGNATQRHQQIITSLMTSLVSPLWRWIFLSVSPDDYRSCRLIQVFCLKYSFVFFYIIVFLLEAWLTNWLTVNLLKKYKIKRKFTFFSKNHIYITSRELKTSKFSCCALMKILMFSTHSMKYIWYSPQKSKYPLCITIDKHILVALWNDAHNKVAYTQWP